MTLLSHKLTRFCHAWCNSLDLKLGILETLISWSHTSFTLQSSRACGESITIPTFPVHSQMNSLFRIQLLLLVSSRFRVFTGQFILYRHCQESFQVFLCDNWSKTYIYIYPFLSHEQFLKVSNSLQKQHFTPWQTVLETRHTNTPKSLFIWLQEEFA